MTNTIIAMEYAAKLDREAREKRMIDYPDQPMCPNCVTPWKCNGPHITAPPAAQPVEKPMHPQIQKMYEDYFDKCFRESQRPWVGLTDEEIARLYKEHAKYQAEGMKLSGWGKFAADVQAKLREKNT